MVISLRCKKCKDPLKGERDEYAFFCGSCKSTYILQNDTLKEIETYFFDNDYNMDFLIPLYLFNTNIEYINLESKKQIDLSIKIGNRLQIITRGISIIDPVYFGDIEIETMHRLNNLKTRIKQEKPGDKIFRLDINPQIAMRLLRYNFMKFFDRQADITGMKYSLTIESFSLLFLKTKIDKDKIYISELTKELSRHSILTI